VKHALCKLSDLAEDSSKAFIVDGVSVLVCRSAAGVFAVENRCTHQLAPLEGGRVRGPHLFCPKHGARFDLRTGVPNQLAKLPLKCYEVELADDEIRVRLA
jgi:3-phenylpropionate/trans-cinnamate dioxygenase ferredoxin subunit